MRKYIFILAVLLFAAQANAQRMVKYITFYPVPYGSHESLSVEAEFMVNMGNEMTSEVGGEVYIGGDSDFEGFLGISAGSGANTVSKTPYPMPMPPTYLLGQPPIFFMTLTCLICRSVEPPLLGKL